MREQPRAAWKGKAGKNACEADKEGCAANARERLQRSPHVRSSPRAVPRPESESWRGDARVIRSTGGFGSGLSQRVRRRTSERQAVVELREDSVHVLEYPPSGPTYFAGPLTSAMSPAQAGQGASHTQAQIGELGGALLDTKPPGAAHTHTDRHSFNEKELEKEIVHECNGSNGFIMYQAAHW